MNLIGNSFGPNHGVPIRSPTRLPHGLNEVREINQVMPVGHRARSPRQAAKQVAGQAVPADQSYRDLAPKTEQEAPPLNILLMMNGPRHETSQSHRTPSEKTAQPTGLDAGRLGGCLAEGRAGYLPERAGQGRVPDDPGAGPPSVLLHEGAAGPIPRAVSPGQTGSPEFLRCHGKADDEQVLTRNEKQRFFGNEKTDNCKSSQGAAGARRKRNKCRRPSEASYAGFLLAAVSRWGTPRPTPDADQGRMEQTLAFTLTSTLFPTVTVLL
jgi:hypothetical protein